MIRKIRAVFDGKVLHPSEPLNLEPNTKVEITLAIPEAKGLNPGSFLDTAESLQLDGPADWSTNVDKYLYGHGQNQDG